jgi:uncharacterized protein (DUF2252 family)
MVNMKLRVHGTPEERHAYGESLRYTVALEDHAEWSPGPERADPVALVEGQNEDRIEWLVPARRARMSANPFTFYRGAARIMAHDLALTPNCGLWTQICGDAHLSNFGVYASPERRLVFDLNDFDETLPGPWEWDVKRLAASLFISSRYNGLDKKAARRVVRRSVKTYRSAMRKLAKMRSTDVWYAMVEMDRLRQSVDSTRKRKSTDKFVLKAKRKDSSDALGKLTEDVDGEYRIRHDPPFLLPLRVLPVELGRDRMRETIHSVFDDYRASLPDHVEHLFNQFEPIELAIKVVGVGSVGTRCFILLLQGRDRKDPLFLQIKEAGTSVLEEHLPQSRYATSGQRVVEGQRLMQTVSDIFLGWTTARDNQYYVRQFKDWKGSADVESAGEKQHEVFARMRGWTLARAHARSGDPVAIAGYLGKKKTFDDAITAFSERYAQQNEEDFEAFRAEIDAGRLDAEEYV